MKTNKTYKLENILKKDLSEGLNVGDRMIIQKEIAKPVAEYIVNFNKNKAYNEYFKVITKLSRPTLDEKKIALEWSFEGVKAGDIIDRFEIIDEDYKVGIELEMRRMAYEEEERALKRVKKNKKAHNSHTIKFR